MKQTNMLVPEYDNIADRDTDDNHRLQGDQASQIIHLRIQELLSISIIKCGSRFKLISKLQIRSG